MMKNNPDFSVALCAVCIIRSEYKQILPYIFHTTTKDTHYDRNPYSLTCVQMQMIFSKELKIYFDIEQFYRLNFWEMEKSFFLDKVSRLCSQLINNILFSDVFVLL